jgi:hypothetical protein
MTPRLNQIAVSGAILAASLLAAPLAHATQGHGAPEGLYAHQLAHLFFVFSMGTLIYWLRKHQLHQKSGWRYIQYAALFFIFWNLDALTVHAIEEQLTGITITRVDHWHMTISGPNATGWLKTLYFLAKLDHLLCVPALIFLYMGLRKLIARVPSEQKAETKPT